MGVGCFSGGNTMSKCSTFNLVMVTLIEAEASSDCFLVGP